MMKPKKNKMWKPDGPKDVRGLFVLSLLSETDFDANAGRRSYFISSMHVPHENGT